MNQYDEEACEVMARAWVNAYIDGSPGAESTEIWVHRVKQDLMTQLGVPLKP